MDKNIRDTSRGNTSNQAADEAARSRREARQKLGAGLAAAPLAMAAGGDSGIRRAAPGPYWTPLQPSGGQLNHGKPAN